MVKISQVVLPLFLAFGSASAFTPTTPMSVRSTALRLSDEAEEGGKLVAIKEETVEFTAGLIGGVAGFAIGGPVLGAIGAAAANYATKTETDASTIISAVSKSSLEVFNYLVKLDSKYEVLTKTKASLESALESVKSNDKVDPSTVKQVEDALASTTSKINEINEEYDLVGAGLTALGVVGDLVEKAIVKAGELNEEYKLTDKAQESLSKAVSAAKDKASTIA